MQLFDTNEYFTQSQCSQPILAFATFSDAMASLPSVRCVKPAEYSDYKWSLFSSEHISCQVFGYLWIAGDTKETVVTGVELI